MKAKQSIFAIISLFSLLTSCGAEPEKGDKGDKGDTGETGQKGDTGEQGPKGDTGEQGPKGDQGVPGKDGTDGKDGSKIYTGSGAPSEDFGVEGDVYVDTSTGDLYTKGTKWDKTGNIKGNTGATIVGVHINDDGYLVCEMSDGREITTEVVVVDKTKYTVNFYIGENIVHTENNVLSGSKITPPDVDPTAGYKIEYWYTKDYGYNVPWSFVGCTVTSDLDLYASLGTVDYTITYELDDGVNNENNPTTYTVESETINLQNPSKDGYFFVGWYSDSTYLTACSSIVKGSVGNKTFYAKFLLNSEAEALGVKPVIDIVNKTATYGLYPQSRVTDDDTITKLKSLTSAESNGWYLLDGAYYAKKTANPDDANFAKVFDNGDKIVKGTEYWFKCELITWNILTSDDGTYTLLAKQILDGNKFGSSRNYAKSNVRTWLNGTFYNTAFYLGLKNCPIQTVEVDNSAATTISSTNSYTCENTFDNVYLLCYQDYLKTEYGFASDAGESSTRYAKTTEYARAIGVGCASSSSAAYYLCGAYATRSPHTQTGGDYVSIVSAMGDLRYAWNSNFAGTRPTIQIKAA